MATFEYKVIPAPKRGVKAKGAKTAEDRFANALQTAMNELAADGWEYQRTDTLPCQEREGLMGKTTVFQNMLVFRRETAASVTERQKAENAQADALRDVLMAANALSTAERTAETLAAPTDPQLLEDQSAAMSDEPATFHASADEDSDKGRVAAE